MAEEIKEGDWISFPASGLDSKGKVLSVDYEGYGVRMESGVTTFVPKGDRVKKIAPPDEG